MKSPGLQADSARIGGTGAPAGNRPPAWPNLSGRFDVTDTKPPLSTALPIEQRIARWTHRLLRQDGECWAWCGARDRNGYGHVGIHGKHVPVHRAFYEFYIGEVPPGLELDHLCRRRNCVNPWHMEPVTRTVNMQRAIGVGQYDRSHLKATHCTAGHELTAENVYVSGKYKKRRCRICARARARAKYQREKAVSSGGAGNTVAPGPNHYEGVADGR